ncbi:hypothetical protein MKW94_025346 [Papaver nudicaule]|uniref:RING-CH-type domain-containing protein n=1 Tax=Papaver nudicaule TaxID=74823 RepID=A0AA41V2M6_PAPNU|nr:hypothetical protein [Papaver nudicaule]
MAEHDQSAPLLTPLTPINAGPTTELDLEAGSVEQNQCRICLKTDGPDFIAPSMCKGASKNEHPECFDQLRSTKEGFAFVHCPNCKAQYHMRVQTAGVDSKWRTLKSRFFVTRDILSIFLSVQIAIALLGYLVYLVDASQNFALRFAFHFDAVVGFYYMCGALLLSVLFGWFGCFLTCSESRLRGDLAQPCPQLTECCCSSSHKTEICLLLPVKCGGFQTLLTSSEVRPLGQGNNLLVTYTSLVKKMFSWKPLGSMYNK